MPLSLMWVVFVAGCAPPLDDLPPPAEPSPTTGCSMDDGNALRAVCHVVREATGPVEVAIILDDGSARTSPGDPDRLEQDLTVWDLVPEEPFTWEIREGETALARGTLVAGAVPGKAKVHVEVEIDGATSIDRVLVPVSCGGPGPALVVLDGLGRVRWYADPVLTALPVSFGQAADGQIAMTSGRYRLLAWAPDGTLLHDLQVGSELDRPMHHSLTGENGELLVLDATATSLSNGVVYIDEGVTRVWPDGTSERAWNLLQVLDPTGLGAPSVPIGFGYWSLTFEGAVDFAHMNGIALAGDGDWIVSLKNLDTVARIDPSVPEVEWALGGSDRAAAWTDLLLAAVNEPVLFEAPHTPRIAPWGSLLLMDSGLPPGTSAVVEVAVDAAAGTAETVRTWELDVSCPVHSSVYGLEDGSVFAACAATGQLFELDDDGIRRRSRVTCDEGDGPGLVLGAQPIQY